MASNEKRRGAEMPQQIHDFDEDQNVFRDALERLVRETSPRDTAQTLDNEKRFDVALHRALAEFGATGLGVPEREGGVGLTSVEQVITLDVLGRLATSMAVFFVIQFMTTRLLSHYGSDAQKKKWLAPLAKGDIKASFCLTEAGGGTDILSSMRTKATRTDDGWLISGSKMWISGATTSDLLIVLARTAPNHSRGVTMFLVPRETPGVSATELRTMAINGYDTNEVGFDDVRAPADAVLGTVDNGFMQVLSSLNHERLNAAAVAIGIGQGAFETAVEYARERKAFGKPIGQFQAVQQRLVEIGVNLQAASLLTFNAAKRDALGGAIDIASSMAKFSASKAALAATDIGMEVMGGAGFDMDLPMQRYFRDARLYVFAPLTNDMILNILGERWLELPRSF